MKKNNLLIGSLSAICCEILYGMSYIFTKQAIQNASPLALLAWRFLLAFLAINILVGIGIIKIDLKGKSLKPLMFVAFFSPVLYFIGETVGISNTTATESGVFLACIPVFPLLASTFILQKKPSKVQVIGILITLCGVLLTVFIVGAKSSFSIIGYLFLLLAVISCALYFVYVEKANQYNEGTITYTMLALGTLVFVILALLEALLKGNIRQVISLPFQDRNFLITVLYQAIGCSIIAFFLTNVAVSKIGVNRTASFIGLSTLTSIVGGVLLLNEPFTVGQMAGVVLILLGVYIANTHGEKRDFTTYEKNRKNI